MIIIFSFIKSMTYSKSGRSEQQQKIIMGLINALFVKSDVSYEVQSLFMVDERDLCKLFATLVNYNRSHLGFECGAYYISPKMRSLRMSFDGSIFHIECFNSSQAIYYWMWVFDFTFYLISKIIVKMKNELEYNIFYPKESWKSYQKI